MYTAPVQVLTFFVGLVMSTVASGQKWKGGLLRKYLVKPQLLVGLKELFGFLP